MFFLGWISAQRYAFSTHFPLNGRGFTLRAPEQAQRAFSDERFVFSTEFIANGSPFAHVEFDVYMPACASCYGPPSMSESSKHVPLLALFEESRPRCTAAIHADHAYLRMSDSTVVCKTQWMVNIQHQPGARSDVPFKLHKTLQNQRGAVYAAVIVPPLVLFSIRRRSPSDR